MSVGDWFHDLVLGLVECGQYCWPQKYGGSTNQSDFSVCFRLFGARQKFWPQIHGGSCNHSDIEIVLLE